MAFRSKHSVVLTDPSSRLNLPSISTAVSNPSLFTYPSPTPYSPSSTSNGSVAISRRKMLTSKQSGCITGWLDAMKGSSPPKGAGQDTVDVAYRTWIAKHPSALGMFEEMMNASMGKQIVVFLDYDGTLSPIVDDPDRAYMSDKMRSTVREVARYFPTAIISGRCRDKVYDFVQLAELYYAGSHGMDIMGPSKSSRGSKANCIRTTDKKDNDVLLYQPASEFLPMIGKAFAALVEKTKRISGACVENNKFCISVHFRRVEEKSWSALAEQVKSVILEYPELRLTAGRKVLEIRPIIKWDKGKALEFLLESLGLADCNDVLPLYIGDDRTDEDAFKVLQDRGQGYGILVSTVPKETNASYSLKEPSEVMDFLRRLVKWKQCSLKGRPKV